MPPPRLRQALRTFRRDERGAVAIIFAVMALTLVTVTAVAIEVGNVYRIRSALQEALDSAMLSAGADPNEDAAHIRQQVRQFFESNLAGVLQAGTVNVTDLIVRRTTRTNITHANLTATGQTFLGGILNRDTVTYALTSTVQRAPPTEVAIVMSEGNYSMLPYQRAGGSSGTSLDVTKRIAKDLVTYILRFPDNRVAIVPYSSLVNTDTTGGRQMPGWLLQVQNIPKPPRQPNPPAGWRGCVGFPPVAVTDEGNILYPHGRFRTDLERPNNLKYPTYQMVPDQPYNAYVDAGLSDRPICRTALIPLYDRSRQQSIVKTISNMWAPTHDSNLPLGLDNLPLGLLWGWHVLTPEEPFGNARRPEEIARIGGKKVVILFTQRQGGGNTLSHPDGQPRQAVSDAEKTRALNLLYELCDNIKRRDANGQEIVIYLVKDASGHIGSPGSDDFSLIDTNEEIDRCASDPKPKHVIKYRALDNSDPFDPGDKLTPLYAMREVGRQLTEPRLVPCPEEFCPP